MTSQAGWQTIVIHILPNVSRSKDNQTMKFGQLIEYNIRKNFFKASYTKCGGQTSSRSFSGKLKLSLSLGQQSRYLYSMFLLCPKLRTIEIYWN